jgi:Schlafen group 3, DNA/RNA helicase domain
MKREYYSSTIERFLDASSEKIIGTLTIKSGFAVEPTQRDAWLGEIAILETTLRDFNGQVYFEYSIPRMGRRIDVVLLIESALFVLEFKIGEHQFTSYAINQAYDYALDLKNFHETSRDLLIAPIVIATNAAAPPPTIRTTVHGDNVLAPMRCTAESLPATLRNVLEAADAERIDAIAWESGRYSPTPTIIEAAMALYNNHSVTEISRNDAAAINLTTTSAAIAEIIENARATSFKAICFVTGVPGAGKTLVGLNIATQRRDESDELHSVFLSGNRPLVEILCEALARDRVRRNKKVGKKTKKGAVLSEVKAFVQNVHHFRDECIVDLGPPIEHVALFDEAQRAWNLEQTASFMRRKKNLPDFNQSEPEFLVSCLDRHHDWAVIVCLVGGGQEINTGEAGISEWINALNHSFPEWRVYISSRLSDSEYSADHALDSLANRSHVTIRDELHLAVSIRSFRAENVSLLIKQLLDLEAEQARTTLANISAHYPIVLTRDLDRAKHWLRERARGSERYGVVASSQAERLKPLALNVKYTIDPRLWFLNGPEDTRSSFYLEDVATEFDVQGLELDWACVTWDADFRYTPDGWEHKSFVGDRWNRINKPQRRLYQKNAYRVLLTRARQGMVICVPSGDSHDPTRKPEFYDSTFEYLRQIGLSQI